MTCLPDVNVWIALTVAGHVHHAAAAGWYEHAPYERIVFSRVTQMAFLRLLTNPKVMGPDALTAARAWKTYDLWRAQERVALAAEPPGLEETWRRLPHPASGGPNFWTDAYLAAFASVSGFALATFDRQLGRRAGVTVDLLRG